MSSPATVSFTPSLVISSGIEKALTSMAGDSMIALVRVLAEKYNFDAESTIMELGLTDIQVTKKKRSAAPKQPKEKKVKEVKPPRDVPACVLPWTGTPVDCDWCQAIKYNHGLYNQCTKERVAGEKYCKACAGQCIKNGTGIPDFGNVEQRMACGLFEYKAGKAQKPCLPLANVLSKFGDVSKENVKAEAARFGLEIPEEQWVAHVAKRGRPKKPESEKKAEEPKEKKKRGRPATKKAKTQESAPTDDLIASLVADAMKNTEPVVEENTEPVVEEKKKAKKPKMTDEEKEAKKAEKKAKKEAEKKAKKEAEEKAKKEAEEKAKKEAEEKAKKEAEEKAAAEKKATEELNHEDIYDFDTDNDDSESEDEDEEQVTVRKFQHEGTTYLRDEKTNVLYDVETQDEIGIWNPETKSIDEIEDNE